MKQTKLSVDNLCEACEYRPDGGCDEPCSTWYRCLQGVPIKDEEVLKDECG